MSNVTPPPSDLSTRADPRQSGGAAGPLRVLLVTGMSGAGKTSALKAFEDIGFEAVDNVPLSLLGSMLQPNLAATPGERPPIAVGVDIRNRDFGVLSIIDLLDRLESESAVDIRILFLDCDDDELRRRYTETRHRHPLAGDRPIQDGIVQERRVLAPLRDKADLILDTTGMAPGELKRLLEGHFGAESTPGLSVFVTSFSFRRGLPREADLVFDVRFLANPHYDPTLRPLTGRDQRVVDHVTEDPSFASFFNGLTGLLSSLLPRYADEGKSYLTIAVGCTGGRHRSVVVAERLAEWLAGHPHRIHLHHRELERADRNDTNHDRGGPR